MVNERFFHLNRSFQIQKRLRVKGMALSSRTIKMQRAFFMMQLLQVSLNIDHIYNKKMFQSVLPLVILSSPFTVFLYGVFTQTDLGLSALWFTSFLWICPSVQVKSFASESQYTSSLANGGFPGCPLIVNNPLISGSSAASLHPSSGES